MAWNKIQVYILLIFYNINKHINFLISLAEAHPRVALIKAYIGLAKNLFTNKTFLI